MYLRTVRAKGAEGIELEYIRLVEAYWENGRSKQRVIANLGRNYYDWRLEQGVFSYCMHTVQLPAEKSLEGKYVIKTE